jgi:hypothetical protein
MYVKFRSDCLRHFSRQLPRYTHIAPYPHTPALQVDIRLHLDKRYNEQNDIRAQRNWYEVCNYSDWCTPKQNCGTETSSKALSWLTEGIGKIKRILELQVARTWNRRTFVKANCTHFFRIALRWQKHEYLLKPDYVYYTSQSSKKKKHEKHHIKHIQLWIIMMNLFLCLQNNHLEAHW